MFIITLSELFKSFSFKKKKKKKKLTKLLRAQESATLASTLFLDFTK